MHKVICTKCGQSFDRDKVPFVQVGARRYAHESCPDSQQQSSPPPTNGDEDSDFFALKAYIQKLFGISYLNASVLKQIRDFRADFGYTYSGIYKTLVYWYEVKKSSKSRAGGRIGIVPYVYDEAKQYYYKIYLSEQLNKGKVVDTGKYEEIWIAPIQANKLPSPRLFFEGDDD